MLDWVIDKHRNVTQVKLVFGTSATGKSRVGRVERWKYQPTVLNGVPVAVEMRVTVHFRLGSDVEN